MRELASGFLLGVMTRVLMGRPSRSLTGFDRSYGSLSALFGVPMLSDFVPWLRWADRLRPVRQRIVGEAARLDSMLDRILRSRLEECARLGADAAGCETAPDVLSALMARYLCTTAATDDNGSTRVLSAADAANVLAFMESGAAPASPNANVMLESINLVKACLMEMLTGSIDTTVALVEWAMLELLTAPGAQKIMARLKAELRGAPKLPADAYRATLATAADTAEQTQTQTQMQMQLQLREEDDVRIEVLGEPGVSELPYLEAILKETLRLHPSAPLLLPHMSMEPTEVAGFFVPENTRLIVNAWAIGMDERVWDNATEFRPERFLDGSSRSSNSNSNSNCSSNYNGGSSSSSSSCNSSSSSSTDKCSDLHGSDLAGPEPRDRTNAGVSGHGINATSMELLYGYLPFGRGRRKCPGSLLGLSMASVLLANLVHNFDWEAVPSSSPSNSPSESSSSSSFDRIVCMDEVLGTSLRPKHPLMAIPFRPTI